MTKEYVNSKILRLKEEKNAFQQVKKPLLELYNYGRNRKTLPLEPLYNLFIEYSDESSVGKDSYLIKYVSFIRNRDDFYSRAIEDSTYLGMLFFEIQKESSTISQSLDELKYLLNAIKFAEINSISMIRHLEEQLEKLGLANQQLNSDNFALLASQFSLFGPGYNLAPGYLQALNDSFLKGEIEAYGKNNPRFVWGFLADDQTILNFQEGYNKNCIDPTNRK